MSSLVPPWARPFLAREQVRLDMATWLTQCRERGIPCLMYVHGLEGLGVSCLVTQFAKDYHALIDGPLVWLPGRAPDGRPTPIGELLTLALRQFDVPDTDQLAGEDLKTYAYHRVTRGKRFILVVDNMATTAQVEALMPNEAPLAVTVATTALEYGALDQRGFRAFTPELLPPTAAEELFRYVLADTAADVSDSVVTALVEICGGIPLLIKVLAGQICHRSRMAEPLLAKLQRSRLELLALDDEQRMIRFLDTAYDTLDPEHAEVYRRLSFVGGGDFSVNAAAAAVGLEVDDAFFVFEELVRRHLLTFVEPNRYAFHAVLRDDAQARAKRDDSTAVQHAVVTRWVTWCLHEALLRAAAVSQRWWVAPVAELYDQLGAERPSREDALEWFDAEWPGLVAAVRIAHRYQLHEMAWQLCVALWKYLHLHKLTDAWIGTHRDGLASARACESDSGVMQLTSQLGALYLEVGQYADASAAFQESLTVARRIGHSLGQQSAWEWLGKIAAAQQNYLSALSHYQQSAEVIDAATDTQIDPAQKSRAAALLRMHSARACLGLERWSDASEHALAACAYFDGTDELDNRAKSRTAYGRALLAVGETDQAASELATAASLFKHDGARRDQAATQRLHGQVLAAAGRPAQAAEAFREALVYYREVGSPLADATAAELAQLD